MRTIQGSFISIWMGISNGKSKVGISCIIKQNRRCHKKKEEAKKFENKK